MIPFQINSDYVDLKIKNWKHFVATVCESFQSSNQTWCTEDDLLWTFFFIFCFYFTMYIRCL